MKLQIIHYPHPTLRHVSKTLKKVDSELRGLVAQMFDLMYEHEGVGLAANQVDLPYRLRTRRRSTFLSIRCFVEGKGKKRAKKAV